MAQYFRTTADGHDVPPDPTRPRRRAAALAAVLAASLLTAATADPGSARPPAKPHPAAQADPATPVVVALDRKLAKAQPGDSAKTREARKQLAAAQRSYAAANQQFDAATAAADLATVRLQMAQRIATATHAVAVRAENELASIAVSIYQDGSPVSIEAQVLLAADNGNNVLNDLERAQQIAAYQAGKLQHASDARDAADRAEAEVAAARDAALTSRADALTAQKRAATAVRNAQRAVGALHLKDLIARAKAAAQAALIAGTSRAHGSDTAAGAAVAIREQAISSGAATRKQFAPGTTIAATIATATRALLRKAARLGTAPVDATTVMGPTPDLGKAVKWKGRTGTGPPLALTRFDGKVSKANWPNAGVGIKVAGTAPLLKTDGVSVHPALPRYPKNYRPLRAEIAVDEALRQLGSPYVWNAAGRRTFDCSGLTLWAWGHAGISLEHYTGTQVHQGVAVAPNQLLPGDLLLFGKDLHHVGMYLGAGYMINAPQTGDYVKVQLVAGMGDFAVAVRP